MWRARRLLAYLPADVALWPQLTGAEILHLQASTGPGVDLAYRDELVERFALDPSKPARTYWGVGKERVSPEVKKLI
jgi:ABC-2 type transport system ATP-binding protein